MMTVIFLPMCISVSPATKTLTGVIAEDAQLNNEALTFGSDRLFSVYNPADHPDWRIWIITEWDRSVTTVLFPDEY